MELERHVSLHSRSYVSTSLREFFQRMLIEHIDSLNAKDQIFSCFLVLI
jgi:hypothetical protein